MKKFRVFWEVSKWAEVEAKNEKEAVEKVMTEKVEQFEDEITESPFAEEVVK